MRIVIDMQGAQTESRFRGIGRYTMGFTQAVVRNRGEHEVILALSGLFPDTIEPIRAAFDGLLPQENIRVWRASGPVREESPDNDARRVTAEMLREAFLASLQPDVIQVTSLIEGFVDDAVTSIGRFDKKTPVSVIYYDLIPLLNPDQYLKSNTRYEQFYSRKIESLKRGAMHLAISDFSRQEAVDARVSTNGHVINISTAIEDHFRPQTIDTIASSQLKQKFGICRLFVLHTGGSDERKNLPRLIEAYAALPAGLRTSHQLVFAGKMSKGDIARFQHIAYSCGLRGDELIFTGYVRDEELVQLYNLCDLYVFPSWHEGFGLPALEAMTCGAPVIASNTTSLPEVIGFAEALFDPLDVAAITQKIKKVLENDTFRTRLREHGLQQAKKFSWDKTAKRAIECWENFLRHEAAIEVGSKIAKLPNNRPRLAYVSPLPPEASGISDYSAELLPELAQHYCIEVIVAQEQVADEWVRANCPIRDVAWFRQYAHQFDRVLYHFGNSPFHSHMFELLHYHPGVVMLHDFFLSNIVSFRDMTGDAPHGWARALLASHGWSAVRARFQAQDPADIVNVYPCNLQVLQDALGVIVHSDYSRQLAKEWYGDHAADLWQLIPLMRKSPGPVDCMMARRALGVAEDEFVVCSFGFVDPTKLNHRLLAAWLASPLAQNKKCRLVFVGQNHGGDYGAELERTLRNAVGGSRIKITGWVGSDTFRQWLVAADVGVQLRTLSRGETSASVLDCMNYGLATIINANGSMAELDQDTVWMLPDEFDDSQLVDALTTLQSESQRRVDLGKKAREVIAKRHDPCCCAAMYANAIEDYYHQSAVSIPSLVAAIAEQAVLPSSEWPSVAACLAGNVPQTFRRKKLLVDVSALVQTDLKTGIERVVRSILMHWLLNPPLGWQVEPVYATMEADGFRYARRYTSCFLGVSVDWVDDEIVEVYPGDKYLGLDHQPYIMLRQFAVLQDWHRRGVAIHFVVYDLLPVLSPDVFPAGVNDIYQHWLDAVAQFDGAVSISRAVAKELQEWLQDHGPMRERPFAVKWFHLGADPKNSAPSMGMPANAAQVLAKCQSRLSFLMVGTIEPRKGHLQTLAAFEELWKHGAQINLIIVGQEGWKGVPDGLRRTIPDVVTCLRNHAKLGKSLFWLEGISDEYLEEVYAASSCLIAASEGEGFGLPLIESAQHKLPIIARDIPVFREVAGRHAFYFENSKDPQIVAKAIVDWLELNASGKAPQSTKMPWLTWAQSAKQLMDKVLGKNQFSLGLNKQYENK